MQKLRNLKCLDIGNNSIGESGARAISEELKDNKSLLFLDIVSNSIGESGAKALAEALRDNKTLEILRLEENKIGDDGTKALAEALRVNETLTELSLFRNEIGDDGAQGLAEALKINKTLTKLNLSGNNFGDVGAKALAEALSENDTLTKLDLSSNNFGSVAATDLAGALSENYTVLELLMPPSINEDLETQIGDYLARNKKIDEIATQISDYYTQDSATSPFPRIDDKLIQDPQICLKIFEKSLSKIIDSKKANGQEVNEEQIKKEFIEHLKSSRGGIRLLLSFEKEKNSFELNLRDYLRSMGVVKTQEDKQGKIENGKIVDEIVNKPDIFPNIQKYLPPLVKASAEAPSANPSSPGARGGGGNPPSR